MEIERKWMVQNWPPAGLEMIRQQRMRQGYVTVRPTVRIREETDLPVTPGDQGRTAYILCLKSASTDDGLARTEVEMEIPKETFGEIEAMIGKPLIEKTRRTYRLPGGLSLEVNQVDRGLPTEFWYAEVEFGSVEQAKGWKPEAAGLGDYLSDDVTGQPGSSMGAYWEETREAAGTEANLSAIECH